jgi:hypothetical protein
MDEKEKDRKKSSRPVRVEFREMRRHFEPVRDLVGT